MNLCGVVSVIKRLWCCWRGYWNIYDVAFLFRPTV